MPIVKPAAEFEKFRSTPPLFILLGIPLLSLALANSFSARTASAAAKTFHLPNNPQDGTVSPFKAVAIPLAEFVSEYARVSGKLITFKGVARDELTGTVTLFERASLKADQLTELFHRVLADNGYSVVDAPGDNGWIVMNQRDARDAALPVYELAETPDTARLVTSYKVLRYISPEDIARTLRSFMPANSRIIPVGGSQVLISDSGSNVRRLASIIARMDLPELARAERPALPKPNRACGERRIEKLVVENLEIKSDPGFTVNGPKAPKPASPKTPDSKAGPRK
jgi:type II secretory pathway component GspD/PulD (secretin)